MERSVPKQGSNFLHGKAVMDRLASSPSPLLRALRASTGEAHQGLEDKVDIENCVRSRDRYTNLLRAFVGFYCPLEVQLSALSGWNECGLNLSERQKTPWLAEDLQALGLTPDEIASQRECAELPNVENLAQGFGCLYVLEGATLGGRQISGMLQESPIPTTARHFFGSYGAETGRRWREFLAALDRHSEAVGATGCSQIVTAAQETFACLLAWIVEECPRHEHRS